ncbi:unnamed protein product [Symbiodinium sp. CCMP2592]|nr:unnamed protein product [Symbiodinium sp. CCMP2592]
MVDSSIPGLVRELGDKMVLLRSMKPLVMWKVEQFCDAVQHVRWNMTQGCFDNTIYKVPYTMQIVILPASPPEDAAANDDGTYIHVFKHVYLHRNKMTARECIDMCYGIALRFDWGTHTRAALMALHYMIDGMGGKQIRCWFVQPKFEKKVTVDQSARDAGHKFIRDMGPRANNLNQFMEWDTNKMTGWTEGSFTAWFFDDVLVHMLGSLRQHAITWIGKTLVGKSLGSKTVSFCQSKYDIDAVGREDLVPSIVTAKHLDFFKSEPLTKLKPGIFDDGMLQKMDSSFLKAFLNPSACNNPYDQKLDESMYQEMQRSKISGIAHNSFLELIHPSFEGVDNMEDMAAIIARTHIIVITENGVYWRLAGAQKSNVKFEPWPPGEPIDILAPSQKPIFLAYKKNPSNHTLPPNFHEDMVWSQEVLGRLFRGEHVPRIMTVRGRSLFGGEPNLPRQIPPRLLDDGQAKAKIKKEQVSTVFRSLKRTVQNDVFRNVCGIKILHWFGLPVSVSGHGPHRVSELNDMIKKFHVQFVPVVTKHVGVDGMYLCHQHGHFTGIWCREGFIRYYDNGTEHVMSMSGLNELVQSPAVCILRLVQRSYVKLHTFCDAGSLMPKHNIEAVCYDMTGPRDIMYQSKECSSRNCRTNYSYNFRWSEGKKINVLRYDDIADGVLFVNAKKCFSLSFLKYHEELLFRGQISTRAIEHAYKTLYTNEDTDGKIIVDFRKCYQSALFYFIALKEFQSLGLHMSLVIDDEISDSNLEVYNAFCHSSIFPPSKRVNVKCLVGDGHLSLKPRCADGPIKRAGRPRTKSKARK